MSTLHLFDMLLDSYVALFVQPGSGDQTFLLNRLVESIKEKDNTVTVHIPKHSRAITPKPAKF